MARLLSKYNCNLQLKSLFLDYLCQNNKKEDL